MLELTMIRALRLRPGDVLVVSSNHSMSDAARANAIAKIEEMLHKAGFDNKCVVLDSGWSIANVLRETTSLRGWLFCENKSRATV